MIYALVTALIGGSLYAALLVRVRKRADRQNANLDGLCRLYRPKDS